MLSRSENRPALSSARPIRLARICGEADVLGVVAAPRPGGDQGQRAEVAVAGADRDDDRRAQAERAQEARGRRARSPSAAAPRRGPAATTAGCGASCARHLTSHCGQRRRPGPHPLLDLRGVAAPADPGRDPRHPAVVDRVDHADVGERRHDHLGHPPQRLGQRQRAVGDRADRVEQPQALRAAGRAPAHPGAERPRARSPSTISDEPHRPARARRRPCSSSGWRARRRARAARSPRSRAGPANSAVTNGAAT